MHHLTPDLANPLTNHQTLWLGSTLQEALFVFRDHPRAT